MKVHGSKKDLVHISFVIFLKYVVTSYLFSKIATTVYFSFYHFQHCNYAPDFIFVSNFVFCIIFIRVYVSAEGAAIRRVALPTISLTLGYCSFIY